ncbi:hypothetical protein WDU94_001749 [Cyamophila willieti]
MYWRDGAPLGNPEGIDVWIKFLNPMISRKPKLQRQRKIFKQQGKNFPRANQMNINVATWGRLLKRSAPSIQNNRRPLPSLPLDQSHSDSLPLSGKSKTSLLLLLRGLVVKSIGYGPGGCGFEFRPELKIRDGGFTLQALVKLTNYSR